MYLVNLMMKLKMRKNDPEKLNPLTLDYPRLNSHLHIAIFYLVLSMLVFKSIEN